MIPEIIGRLPLFCSLDELDETALLNILTEPKNALVKQYTRLFEMDGIELEFNGEALKKVVEISVKKGTGARGLRSVLGRAMMDVMFRIPSMPEVKRVVITEATIETGEMPDLERDDGAVLRSA
jgi:ATP-dependent Clp protease ATP-binding subunit ClpX